MWTRNGNDFWQRADGATPATTRPAARGIYALGLCSTLLLGGCVLSIPTPRLYLDAGLDSVPVDAAGPWRVTKPNERELLLARSDFDVEIVQFSDVRVPVVTAPDGVEKQLYVYEPDQVLHGVTTQVPALLGKYLSYRQDKPKNYAAHVMLHKLNTRIARGTLLSGSWGRYQTELELSVGVRRQDGPEVLKRTYRLQEERQRVSTDGRSPSQEFDRSALFAMTEAMMRKAALQIAWDVRQNDARSWDLTAEKAAAQRAAADEQAQLDALRTSTPPEAVVQPTPEVTPPLSAPSTLEEAVTEPEDPVRALLEPHSTVPTAAVELPTEPQHHHAH